MQVILVRERAWKEVHSYLAKLKKPSYCIDLQNKLIKTSPRYLTLEFLVEIIALLWRQTGRAFVGTWSFDTTF